MDNFLSRVVGDTLAGGTYSSRNFETSCPTSKLSPVVVIVRLVIFKQGLRGVFCCGVAARAILGRGVVGRGVEGTSAANHGVVGRAGLRFSPSTISGNKTLWNFGVEGSSPKPALTFLDLNMIVKVAEGLI
jgi:hypothetical protein